MQKDFACPDNPLSTILHELIHWQDAEKYRSKFGEITEFNKYCDYLYNIYLYLRKHYDIPTIEWLKKRGPNPHLQP